MSTFVAILGPPGGGKSTLTKAFSTTPDVLVFRLRDFCLNQARHDPTLAAQLQNSPDPLGWLDDATVGDVLARAFQRQRFPSGTPRAVLLENFPGSAPQVELLVEVLAASDAACQRLAAIELAAPEAVLRHRVARRRVCPSCEPDPHDDPHRPAVPAVSAPQRCAKCGGQLAVRRGDAPGIFSQRLARFRAQIPGIRSALTARGVPVERLDATRPVAQCVATAADALSRAPTLRPHRVGRHPLLGRDQPSIVMTV